MPRTRQETSDFVISSIRALGFNPNPSSRLMTMHRILTASDEIIMPSDPKFRIALEADRDMQYLEFVFEQHHAVMADGGLIALLKPLCDDSMLPLASGNSKGRDTQLELFSAALCQCAGFAPVRYEEPDVMCAVDAQEVSVACKRAKSEHKVNSLLHEARDQITREHRPGVIVMETTVALNPGNHALLTPMSDEVLQPLYMLRMQQFIDRHKVDIQAAMQSTPVIGVIFHDSVLRFELDGRYSLTAMTYELPIIQDLDLMRLFTAFKRGYLNALPNVEHLTSSM